MRMNYDEFFTEGAKLQLRVTAERADIGDAVTLSNEALFQLPFLAMTVLMLAKGKRKPLMSEIGQLVGECLERAIAGFKGSSQDIGWSANLRIRTVKALTFLETANLVSLHRATKAISTTETGRNVIERAINTDGRLANALITVERSYQNITAEKQMRLRLQ
ncbi:MAG: hypothetical protein IH604_10735 [Burkholderiales bacterium]|nr:hypothetical protein [Burkholderiales bacterium]